MVKFGKSYKTTEEFKIRKVLFLKSRDEISKLESNNQVKFALN
jgi:hypothetical protein